MPQDETNNNAPKHTPGTEQEPVQKQEGSEKSASPAQEAQEQQESAAAQLDDAQKQIQETSATPMQISPEVFQALRDALMQSKEQQTESMQKLDQAYETIKKLNARVEQLEANDRTISADIAKTAAADTVRPAQPETLPTSDRSIVFPKTGQLSVSFNDTVRRSSGGPYAYAQNTVRSESPGAYTVTQSTDRSQWIVTVDPRFTGTITVNGQERSFGSQSPADVVRKAPTPPTIPANQVQEKVAVPPSSAVPEVSVLQSTTEQQWQRLDNLRKRFQTPDGQQGRSPELQHQTLLTRIDQNTFELPVGELFAVSYRTPQAVSDGGYQISPTTSSVENYLYSLKKQGNRWTCTLKPGTAWAEITVRTQSGKMQTMRVGEGVAKAPESTKTPDALPPIPDISFPEESDIVRSTPTAGRILSAEEIGTLQLPFALVPGEEMHDLGGGNFSICDAGGQCRPWRLPKEVSAADTEERSEEKDQSPEVDANTILEVRSATDFEELVLRSPVPVVIDFYMDGCKACGPMEVQLQNLLQQKAGKLRVVKINGPRAGLLMNYAPLTKARNFNGMESYEYRFPALSLYVKGVSQFDRFDPQSTNKVLEAASKY